MEKFYHIFNFIILARHSEFQYSLANWCNIFVSWFTLVTIVSRYLAFWVSFGVYLVCKVNSGPILFMYYIEIWTHKHTIAFYNDYNYSVAYWSNIYVFWITLVTIVPKFLAIWLSFRVFLVPKINSETILPIYYIEIFIHENILAFIYSIQNQVDTYIIIDIYICLKKHINAMIW